MGQKHNYLILLIGLIFVIALLNACKESSEPPKPEKPDIYSGICTATINGIAWEACPYAKTISNSVQHCYIEANHLLGNVFINESISFTFVPKNKVGTHGLGLFGTDTTRMSFYYLEHDATLAYYAIGEDDPVNGTLTVNYYDETTGEIEGTFEATLYLQENYDKPGAPDSLVIEDGYFMTRLID